MVDRPRPPQALVDAAGSSYPSGHAAYAMAWIVLAVVAVRVVPWLRGRWWLVIAAIVVAALVGLTRVYLRVHYLSDVLGGEGAAAMCFSLVAIAALIVAFVRQNGARG
jgi:undecaprenyl-diphosphatase